MGSESAMDRILGGAALNFNLTEEEYVTIDNAYRNQVASTEAPALLGIQVHRVPWWLQILYMIGVVAALAWVIMKAVTALTARDREKEKEKQSDSRRKEGKKSK